MFKIKSYNIEYLAEALLEISYGYENDPELEQYPFIELVDQFLSEVNEGEIVPACPNFVEYYLEFISKEEED